MATLSKTDILLFSQSSGTGREENDKRNKQREFVLAELFLGHCDDYCSDPTFGDAWTELKTAFLAALQHMATLEGLSEAVCVKVQQRRCIQVTEPEALAAADYEWSELQHKISAIEKTLEAFGIHD